MIQNKIAVTKEIMDLFKSYHVRNGAWGVFHVLLDDRNLKLLPKEDSVFTEEERLLLSLLRRMSPTQRGKIATHC